MTADDRELVKVVFRIEGDDSFHAETPWARRVGPSEYELTNLPWYAYGISVGDIFEATPEPDDPRPHLRRVIRKCGNRTVRIILSAHPEESEASATVLQTLVNMGCLYEGANGKYLAVNIPPETDFGEVCDFLTTSEIQWEHADPTWESLHPGKAGQDGSDAG